MPFSHMTVDRGLLLVYTSYSRAKLAAWLEDQTMRHEALQQIIAILISTYLALTLASCAQPGECIPAIPPPKVIGDQENVPKLKLVAKITPEPRLKQIHSLSRTKVGTTLVIGSQYAVEMSDRLDILTTTPFDWWPPEVDRERLRPVQSARVIATQIDEDAALEFVKWNNPGFTFTFDCVDDDGSYLWSLHGRKDPLQVDSEIFDMILLTTGSMVTDQSIVIASGNPDNEAITLDSRGQVHERHGFDEVILKADKAVWWGHQGNTIALIAQGEDLVRLTTDGAPSTVWSSANPNGRAHRAVSNAFLSLTKVGRPPEGEYLVLAELMPNPTERTTRHVLIRTDARGNVRSARHISVARAHYLAATPVGKPGEGWRVHLHEHRRGYHAFAATLTLFDSSTKPVSTFVIELGYGTTGDGVVFPFVDTEGNHRIWVAWGSELHDFSIELP